VAGDQSQRHPFSARISLEIHDFFHRPTLTGRPSAPTRRRNPRSSSTISKQAWLGANPRRQGIGNLCGGCRSAGWRQSGRNGPIAGFRLGKS
jgi:hypothetical protein